MAPQAPQLVTRHQLRLWRGRTRSPSILMERTMTRFPPPKRPVAQETTWHLHPQAFLLCLHMSCSHLPLESLLLVGPNSSHPPTSPCLLLSTSQLGMSHLAKLVRLRPLCCHRPVKRLHPLLSPLLQSQPDSENPKRGHRQSNLMVSHRS